LTISTIARLITYGATCVDLPVFRHRKETAPAAFRLPGGTIIAVVVLILIVWLLSHSTAGEAVASAWAMGAGLLIYLLYWIYSRLRSSS
jgi:APA family basic amino acid/polyamine antiporter